MLSRIMMPTSPTLEMDKVHPESDETSSVLTHEKRSEQIISLIAAPITAAVLACLLRRLSVADCEGMASIAMDQMASFSLVYLFMVDKAHIIRGTTKSRLQSKLYVFNSILVLGIYSMIATLNYVSHGAHYDNDAQSCVVELTGATLLPVLCFDTVVNVYLTSMFLVSLFILFTSLAIHWINSSGRARPCRSVELESVLATVPASPEALQKD
ncbi:hypothetical protein CSHISOI_11173, partial [Colletotrichum shisoi]